MEPSIAANAEWACRTLLVYQQYTGSNKEDALRDLLSDLMHWADEQGFDFGYELEWARTHYAEEIAEQD
jgi:hypothetical protein